MPACPLVLFPDPRLSLRADPVIEFGPSLKGLADDVRDTLMAASAIGLTAPHIGVPTRLMVTRMSPTDEVRVYVNPVILWASIDTATHDEGSVSMPGLRERITRAARIRFAYRDLDGVAHEAAAEGLPAAVIQHEIDQLDGVFWIACLSRLKRERLLKRFEKLKSAPTMRAAEATRGTSDVRNSDQSENDHRSGSFALDAFFHRFTPQG